MSPRGRVITLTSVAAVAAAALVAGVVALQSDPVETAAPGPVRQQGAPPLTFELGFRRDREAVALRAAARLYADGRRVRAGRAFAAIDSVEGRVGQAFATWPEGTVDRMNRLAGLYPQRAVVQLNLGITLYWSGLGGAQDAWRAAAASEPDTPYAITAGNLLYPEYAPGVPRFTMTNPPVFDAGMESSPEKLLAELRVDAAKSVEGKLRYGVALQGLGRQRSAARVFAAAAREAPGNVEAQVAAAVGRFDKARPAVAFSRLGPLTRKFPNQATVRFHLGLLLLWSGEVKQARTQLTRATRLEPGSPLARRAQEYLDVLDDAGR